MQSRTFIALLPLLVLLSFGCSPSAPSSAADPVIPAPTVAITLTEDLRLGVYDPLFGNVGTVVADDAGVMYVADRTDESALFRFSPSGEPDGLLGGSGEGPGEYQGVGSVITSPDSIVVFDYRRDVLHVYGSNGVYRRTSARIESPTLTSVSVIGRIPTGYLVAQRTSYSTGMERGTDPDNAYRLMSPNGVLGDTVWTSRPSEALVYATENMVSMMTRPFGRNTYCAAIQESLYCAWSARLQIDGVTVAGDTLPPLVVEYTPIPVSAAEKAKERENVADIFQDQLVVPDTRPALDGLVSDDRGRLWAKVRLTTDDDVTNYWIIDPSDRSVVSAHIDANVTVRSVKDGRVYGVLYSPGGEQFVVRYEISE